MCVIIALKPNQKIPYAMLETACFNNWHSFGLVVKVDGKLDIIKEVPKSGEVDPKRVEKLLKDNEQYERFLHLRHNTAGATTMENTHPFEVFYDEKKGEHVVFMHNGTFYQYKSKKVVNGIETDDDSGPSDTKNFVDRILIPYVSAMDFGTGRGDISHPLFTQLIEKMWPSGSNRGLLISSKHPSVFIDKWEDVGPEGSKFKASNNDYFTSVKRGPEHSRREVRRKEQESKLEKGKKGGTVIYPVQDFRAFSTKSEHAFYSLSTSIVSILNDWDFYDRANCTSLGYASKEELEELHGSKDDCIAVMDWAFTDYAKLYEEYLELEDKHKRASNKIAELVEELRSLKKKEAA